MSAIMIGLIVGQGLIAGIGLAIYVVHAAAMWLY